MSTSSRSVTPVVSTSAAAASNGERRTSDSLPSSSGEADDLGLLRGDARRSGAESLTGAPGWESVDVLSWSVGGATMPSTWTFWTSTLTLVLLIDVVGDGVNGRPAVSLELDDHGSLGRLGLVGHGEDDVHVVASLDQLADARDASTETAMARWPAFSAAATSAPLVVDVEESRRP